MVFTFCKSGFYDVANGSMSFQAGSQKMS